jgi:hypothetical protein
LRRFLSRLGGLGEVADGQGTGPAWLLWIGTATAVIMVSRTVYGPRQSFPRRAAGTVSAAARRPIPVGPWPLGSP